MGNQVVRSLPGSLFRPRRRVWTVFALLVALLTGLLPYSAAATPPVGQSTGGADAGISGKVVPAVRGDALTALNDSTVAETFRNRREARDLTPTRTAPAAPSNDESEPWVYKHPFWWTGANVTGQGAQAIHTINPQIDFSATNPDLIYAPTLLPSNISCIEMTTFYYKDFNGVGAWDWCDPVPRFMATMSFDDLIQRHYTATYNGRPAYKVRAVQTDSATNTWTSYLFNYMTGSWDTFYTKGDLNELDNGGLLGWDAFEIHTNYNPATGVGYYCTESFGSQFQAADIQFRVNGVWGLATPSNSYNYPAPADLRVDEDFGCYGMSFTVNTANSNWQVNH